TASPPVPRARSSCRWRAYAASQHVGECAGGPLATVAPQVNAPHRRGLTLVAGVHRRQPQVNLGEPGAPLIEKIGVDHGIRDTLAVDLTHPRREPARVITLTCLPDLAGEQRHGALPGAWHRRAPPVDHPERALRAPLGRVVRPQLERAVDVLAVRPAATIGAYQAVPVVHGVRARRQLYAIDVDLKGVARRGGAFVGGGGPPRARWLPVDRARQPDFRHRPTRAAVAAAAAHHVDPLACVERGVRPSRVGRPEWWQPGPLRCAARPQYLAAHAELATGQPP